MVMVLVVVERRVEMVAQWLGLRAGLPGLTRMAARTHLATLVGLMRGCTRPPFRISPAREKHIILHSCNES